VPESRIKDRLSGYQEFLVIKVEVIITRLIALISLPYSHSLDVGSMVGVADCDFFIAGVFNRSLFANWTLSYRLGVLLTLSLNILVMCARRYYSSSAMLGKAY
jgi:hypothetical protein